MRIWSVVVAGGSGNRYGGLKQLDPLRGRRVLDWAVDAMGTPGRCVVVVPPELADEIEVDGAFVVAGGASRSESVRAGLAALGSDATHVLVHDGARPLVPAAVVDRVVAGLADADGVVPVVPVTDTLRRHDGSVVDRSALVAVQTPQAFAVAPLRAAHAKGEDATDDATLVAAVGGSVIHVDGDPTNLKITVPTDLLIAEVLLDARTKDAAGHG